MTMYKCIYFSNYLRATVAGDDLDTLRVEMKDGQFKHILASRADALATGVLFREDEPWVNAMMGIDGDTVVPVRMRLKGLLNDHRDTKKWSYRVSMASEHAYAGMTAFSIQHPGTRGFLEEWVYLESMRAEGLLAPSYTFANVIFNGDQLGIHGVEEHVTSRGFLESHQRRDGVILRIDDAEIWRQFIALRSHLGTVQPAGFANNLVHEYRAGRNQRDAVLRQQRDAAVRLLVDFTSGKRSGSEVFDVELTSRFLALHELWSSSHVLGPPNAKFYYNTLTGRLEPIAGDAEPEFNRGPHLVALPPYYGDTRDIGNGVFWPPLFLRDPVAMKAYVGEVLRVSQPEYLEQLRQRLHEDEHRYLMALWREYPHVGTLWEGLKARQAQLRAMLDVSRSVIAYGQYGDHGVALIIGNALGLPVEVLQLEIDRREGAPHIVSAMEAMRDDANVAIIMESRRSVILPTKRFDQPARYVQFEIADARAGWPSHTDEPAEQLLRATYVPPGLERQPQQQPVVRIHTRILGHHKVVVVEAMMGEQLLYGGDAKPAAPTVEDTLERYPFLISGDSGRELTIRPGTWELQEDFILPKGVTIAAGPGTVLRFAPQALMLARGPLQFEGDADAPIVLEPTHDSWPGLAVFAGDDNGEPSVLRHVIIRRTRGIDRNGWHCTGGVTFYESPVGIIGCRFDGSFAEDALNIVRTNFTLQESVFRDCVSDALDADFCHGVITSCRFENVMDDAIDVSGSVVRIYDVAARNVGDKVVSAGEGSHVEIDGLHVHKARFAIASKDLSFVLADRVSVVDSDVGLAAFVKKPHYGPASINAVRIEMRSVKHETLVQTDSWVKANFQLHHGGPLDVRALYDIENAHKPIRVNEFARSAAGMNP